jgi:hypothetical protein
MLRNPWLPRLIDPHDYYAPENATHCVVCRATGRVIFYGSFVDCARVARERNR